MKKTIWHSIFYTIRNKYFISLLGFTIWILVFDQQNLIDRYKTKRHLNQLKQDTTFYHEQIIKEQTLIHQLQTSPENLEKYAREQYFMKNPDEDIFIIKKKSEIN